MAMKNTLYKNNDDVFKALAEKLKGQAVRPNMYGYQPHAKQLIFHKDTSKKKLYIGGNRSGKTVGGILEDLFWLTGRHPYRELPEGQIRGRVVTVDYVNGLSKIILPEIKRWIPASDLVEGSWEKSYDKVERVLTLANGNFVEFMSYDQDLDKFAGTSRHFIHFDEEPPQDIYTECLARLVDTGGSFWITMTPVEGMTWVYDVLYEPGIAGEGGIKVVEISMTENPYLGEAEVQDFLGALSVDERKAREHGQFVQLGGLVYKDFDKEIHVIKKFVPPKDWIWAASLDHGYNNPTAWLWHAISPDGNVVTFYEHYKTQMVIQEHAQRVHEINTLFGRPPDYYIGDPSIRNTDPITRTSIQQEYVKYGIPITLGNNDVVAGINRVASYLRVRPASGQPNWHISEECSNLIKELSRYRWATYANKRLQNKNNNQEHAHKKDDHACDSARYFFMSRPQLAGEYETRKQTDQAVKNPFNYPVVAEGNVIRAGDEFKNKATVWTTESETSWEVQEVSGWE